MPIDEPVCFDKFKNELFNLFKTCKATPEINTNLQVYHPYSIAYTYKLSHSAWKLKIDPGSPIVDILNSEYTQDFLVDSKITFEFYYMTNAMELHDTYAVRIKISHLYDIKEKIFMYNTLREFMKTFTEIFSLFKSCIESKSTENVDLVIKNFENYCEISQL